jgi:hypothetical protein
MTDTFINAATAATGTLSCVPGLSALCAETLGDPRICIAVLDGPVDGSHPCFAGAQLTALPTLVSEMPGDGRMAAHGTHIASMLFGRPGSPIRGIAPGCRGVIAPIFSDERQGPASQLDLARAIQQAVEAGAHVINISGGEFAEDGDADPMLIRAVNFCKKEGVLVVAAAGNDSCRCLHVPAALPSVLAVGAMDASGVPLDSSNWGDTYKTQGVLAPGHNMLGAIPGGAVAAKSGTSFATPVVSGVVALLLSAQAVRGERPDAYAVRDAILASAIPCDQQRFADCQRFMAGRLNVSGAYSLLSNRRRTLMSDKLVGEPFLTTPILHPAASNIAGVVAHEEAAAGPGTEVPATDAAQPGQVGPPGIGVASANANANYFQGRETDKQRTIGTGAASMRTAPQAGAVVPSACSCKPSDSTQYVFAIGTLGYDFGTEARRDTFKQLMPSTIDGVPIIVAKNARVTRQPIVPNPYDPRQIVNYLAGFPRPIYPFPTEGGFPTLRPDPDNPSALPEKFPAVAGTICPEAHPGYENYPGFPAHFWDATELIWTLNIELTPIYAIRPFGSFGAEAYQRVVEAFAGQLMPSDAPEYVERVSIPGRMTGETVTLFSGQVVPVLVPLVRGMFSWNVNRIIDAVVPATPAGAAPDELVRQNILQVLNRIYYDLRNLGQTSAERALNFSATNLMQVSEIIIEAVRARKLVLDTVDVERSAFCRKDSDCWDVKWIFFDAENDRRARQVYRLTIDVSDVYPVSVGTIRQWSESGS